MIETKDVVAKGLEIESVYSTCPLCGRKDKQRVVVIYEPDNEPDKVKDCLRARHSYDNNDSEPVCEILHNDSITKYHLNNRSLFLFENYAVRFVCSKCNTMYAPDPLQEHSIYEEQGWGFYFRVNRPKEFPLKQLSLKMAVGIKCDSCREDIASPYHIREQDGKIGHYCNVSPNRCGPNVLGEIERTLRKGVALRKDV